MTTIKQLQSKLRVCGNIARTYARERDEAREQRDRAQFLLVESDQQRIDAERRCGYWQRSYDSVCAARRKSLQKLETAVNSLRARARKLI